jgi:hypothetical protein
MMMAGSSKVGELVERPYTKVNVLHKRPDSQQDPWNLPMGTFFWGRLKSTSNRELFIRFYHGIVSANGLSCWSCPFTWAEVAPVESVEIVVK